MNIIVAVPYDIELYRIECRISVFWVSSHVVYLFLKICIDYSVNFINHHNLGDEGQE